MGVIDSGSTAPAGDPPADAPVEDTSGVSATGIAPAGLVQDMAGVQSIHIFDAATQTWQSFFPGFPGYGSALRALHAGDRVFIRYTGAATAEVHYPTVEIGDLLTAALDR